MRVPDRQWEESLNLLQKLIQAHPVYGSTGLQQAQSLLVAYMREQKWDEVYLDLFSARDIAELKGYVDVAAFGSFYRDYAEIPKYNAMGILHGCKPGPTLLLNGHVDVDRVLAPDSWDFPESWRSGSIKEGRLYGRGSTDMLSGLISLLTVANVLNVHRDAWCGTVILTAVTDEEIGGNGTLRSLEWLKQRQLLGNRVECLIAEPSNRKVCLHSLGFLHVIVEFFRSPVHMGVAARAHSALWDAFRFIDDFDSLLLRAVRQVDPSVEANQLIFNFGIIRGGEDAAIPIAHLQVEGTLFFPPSLSLDGLARAIEENIIRSHPASRVCLGGFGFEGAEHVPGRLYPQLSSRIPPGLFPSPCDARLYKQYGIPTVIYGPGGLEEAHAVNESIALNELIEYGDHLLGACLGYLTDD